MDDALEEARKAKEAYIDALTAVARVALAKAGLIVEYGSREHEGLRHAIANVLL